jgi:4-hydroxy-tetrahydrodipicolinate synthase
LEFLAETSIKGIAINGATGEFCATRDVELPQLLQVARRILPGHQIFCGIGSATLQGTLARGRVAMHHGADALLLPMPYFFPYRQDDVSAFVSEVASELDFPILLYNLPQFTTGLDADTVLSLFEKHTNIVGIKDSSGSLKIMRAMTQAGSKKARLIGNDSVLCEALKEGVCDGAVSGVACVLPELMTSIVEHSDVAFTELGSLLEEFIAHISVLPTPWGLQVTSASRGLGVGAQALPLSPQRKTEIAELKEWFEQWIRSTAVARVIPGVRRTAK